MSGVAAQWFDAVRRGRERIDSRTSALIGFLVFIAGTAILVAVNGVMLSRDLVFLWVLVGLLAVSIADLRGWATGVIFDWLPFFAALFAYDVLRGKVGNDPLFTPHVLPQIHFDEFLFGTPPTVYLQGTLHDVGQLHFYDIATWAIYLTHFFAVFLIAGVLWRFARPRFLEFRAMVLTLTFAAFATYALFPAVPPWMASQDGAIGPVTRVIGNVWKELGVDHAAALWERGSTLANEVAAIPSLHAAYPALFVCFFWSSGTRARIITVTYALAMAFTLVYTGEHYVFDIALGWLYALATWIGVGRVLDWRAGRAFARAQLREMQTPAGEPSPVTATSGGS